MSRLMRVLLIGAMILSLASVADYRNGLTRQMFHVSVFFIISFRHNVTCSFDGWNFSF